MNLCFKLTRSPSGIVLPPSAFDFGLVEHLTLFDSHLGPVR